MKNHLPKAPLVNGSWHEGPEGLPRRSGQREALDLRIALGSPFQGSCQRS